MKDLFEVFCYIFIGVIFCWIVGYLAWRGICAFLKSRDRQALRVPKPYVTQRDQFVRDWKDTH